MTYLFQTNIEPEGGLLLHMYLLRCETKVPQEPNLLCFPPRPALPSSLASPLKANPKAHKRGSHRGSF